MTIYSIQVIVTVVNIEDGVNEDFKWGQEDHKRDEIDVFVWDGATEPTVKHVGKQY